MFEYSAMNMESLKAFLTSLGFCADGNGFKTSTMRLGADVIVLTRKESENGYEWVT
jgi:hypothetical protein